MMAGRSALDGSAVAFTPASLSSGTAWYDPSDLSTMFQDVLAMTAVTASGQTCQRVNDKFGSGRYMANATAGTSPAYTSSSGLHYLLGDGTDDELNGTLSTTLASGIITASAYEVCIGARIASSSTNTANGYDNKGILSETGGYFNSGYARSSNAIGGFNWHSGTKTVEDSYTFGTDVVISQRHESNSLYIRLNSATEVSTASVLDTDVLTGTVRLFRTLASGSLSARIYGIVVCNAVLSSTERNDLRTWMAAKSGVTL